MPTGVARAHLRDCCLGCGCDCGDFLPSSLTARACVACQVDGDAIRGTYSPSNWNTLVAGNVLTSEVTDGGAGAAQEGTCRPVLRNRRTGVGKLHHRSEKIVGQDQG